MKTVIVPMDHSNLLLVGLNLSLMPVNKTLRNPKMVHVTARISTKNAQNFEIEQQ
jgi:hypothetical protein